MKEKWNWVYLFFCFLLGINLIIHSMIGFIHRDEIEFVHTIWLIYKGKIIYQDFFQHHHFLAYYMFLPFLKVFGESIKTLYLFRFIFLVFSFGTSLLIYRITKGLFGKRAGLWALVFLFVSPLFIMDSLKIRTDTIMVFFSVLSVFFLLRYFEKDRMIFLAVSVVFLALALLTLQKSIFLVLIFYAALMLRVGVKPVWVVIRDLLFSLALFAGVCATFYLLFVEVGFADFVNLNWVVNYHWDNHVSMWVKLLQVVITNLPIWLFVVLFFFSPKKWSFNLFVFVFITLGLFLFTFSYKNMASRHYLSLLPFLAVLAGCGYHFLSERMRPVLKTVLAVSFFLPMFIYGWVKIDHKITHAKTRLIDWVQQQTSPDDLVYDSYNAFNLFRFDADYFWFSTSPTTGGLGAYKKTRVYDYDLARVVREKKPKVVYDVFITPPVFFELAKNGYRYVSVNEIGIENHRGWDEKFNGLFLRQ